MTLRAGTRVAYRSDEVERQFPIVLVVDDDPHQLARLKVLLHTNGFQSLCAQTGRAAHAAAASRRIAVALIDYRLRGTDGLTVALALKREYRIPFVMMSGYLHTDLTVHAMRSGAFDVVDKPILEDRLIAALGGAISTEGGTSLDYLKRYLRRSPEDESVSSRWATFMLRGCTAARDPRTVSAVARSAGVSTAVFRSVCYICGVKPSKACWLCRFLRAVALSIQDGSTILSHLHFGDRRTAEGSFRLAGLELSDRMVSLSQFFQKQGFVSTELDCVRELAHCAANSPLFISESWDDRVG